MLVNGVPSDLEPLLSRALAGEASGSEMVDALSVLPPMKAVTALQVRALQLLDRSPRIAYVFAELAYALARRGKRQMPLTRGWKALLSRSAITLAAAERRHARYPQAERLLDEAYPILVAPGYWRDWARYNAERAWIQRDLDRYRQAEESFRHVISTLRKAAPQRRRGRRPASEASAETSMQALLAYCYRGLGQALRGLNRYAEANEWAEAARTTYERAGLPLAAARCETDIAFHLLLNDRQEAVRRLAHAREVFTQAGATADLAEVDQYTALIQHEQTHFTEALPRFQAARAVFEAEGLLMRAALTEVNEANTYLRMGALEKALELGERARARMVEAGRPVMVVACDVNLGLVHHTLGQGREALTRFERALALCEGQNLPVDAARCRLNMALVYEQNGDYARALAVCQRARDELDAAGIAMYRAHCDQNLGALYLRVGQYERALERFGAARETFADERMPGYTARCDMQMAAVQVEMGELDKAQELLERAQATCRAQGMTLGADLCDVLLAEVEDRRGEAESADARYRSARERLAAAGLLVDAALCSIALGELGLKQGEPVGAEAEFGGALPVLADGFPDHAWRAAYGLARARQARGDRAAALAHYREAAEFIRRARATLWAEEPSATFFAQRRHVFATGIRLAVEMYEQAAALELLEDSKTQALLTSLRSSDVGLGREGAADSYVRQLYLRERALRQQLQQVRSRASVTGSINTRGGSLPTPAQAREGLVELAQVQTNYAAIMEALRAQQTAACAAPYAPPFRVEAFRSMAAEYLPAGWACLAYYLEDDELNLFYLDEGTLQNWQRRLERYDTLVLAQATDPALLQRERTYGTPRDSPSDGRILLRHLRRLLIPPEVEARLSPERSLWVVPHGRLHYLPFHALPRRKAAGSGREESYLGQEAVLYSVPSLHLLEHLARSTASRREATTGQALVCGISDFGGRAPPLRHAPDEALAVATITATGPGSLLLLEKDASLASLERLQEDGDLAQFDIIHLATHAVFDPQAPLSSRILLSDGDLDVADILRLRLQARLVVLSACQSGLSPLAPGDEMVGLLQALIYAGARAVLASLWPVDDGASREGMQRFYTGLSQGDTPARALQRAQAEMDAAGYSPYVWAAFQLFGI
ncbi:MAG: CHAT domain-containing protein [Anaerolineae bacterium]|nr:CHAT domain-containing protein [Anaerolineae bacterium]